MGRINIVEICSCTALDHHLKPLNKKNVFNYLDEVVIVWCKAVNIKQDTKIMMEWYNPGEELVFTISIDLEKTNNHRPFRYFWSLMKYSLLYGIQGKKFGKWTVKITPLNIMYTFMVTELSTNYKNKMNPDTKTSLFDKTI
ncbi:hypothetical protein JCM14450A_28630 [Geobacillus stearothermophilus]